MRELPDVLVTSCRGADQGAMSVIRTLGRRGVQVSVLSDSDRCLTRHSRYCASFTCLPNYTLDPHGTLEWLLDWAARRPTVPVLFPTADPDLKLLTQLRPFWDGHFRHFLGRPDIVESLMDKVRFMDLAAKHEMPVPVTYALERHSRFVTLSERLSYPVVLKPGHPGAWTHPEIQKIVRYRKALIVGSSDALRGYVEAIRPWSDDLIIQECIVGPDEHHYSAHAFVRQDGEPLALFTGRKLRVHPPFAGSGCFVRSVRVPELVDLTLEILKQIRYRGIAVLNFKQDVRTGRFLLHEINPRISQWNILGAASGVDVAWAAYADASGLAVSPMREQTETMQYVDLRNDLKSWASYRRVGLWGVRSYLGSLLQRRTVHQLFSTDDVVPFLVCCGRTLRSLLGRLLRPTKYGETWASRMRSVDEDRALASRSTAPGDIASPANSVTATGEAKKTPHDVEAVSRGVRNHGLRTLVPVAALHEGIQLAVDALLCAAV